MVGKVNRSFHILLGLLEMAAYSPWPQRKDLEVVTGSMSRYLEVFGPISLWKNECITMNIADLDVPRTHRSRMCSVQTRLQGHRNSVAGLWLPDNENTYWARCIREHRTPSA